MTTTYDLEQLATNTMMQVRFLIGDVKSSEWLMQDEEINFALTLRPSLYGSAATCCMSLSNKFSREADSVTGELKTTYSAKAKAYAARAAYYETQAAIFSGAMPVVGGVSIADKMAMEGNEDRVPPQFNVGMTDNWYPVAPAGNESGTPTVDPADVGP